MVQSTREMQETGWSGCHEAIRYPEPLPGVQWLRLRWTWIARREREAMHSDRVLVVALAERAREPASVEEVKR